MCFSVSTTIVRLKNLTQAVQMTLVSPVSYNHTMSAWCGCVCSAARGQPSVDDLLCSVLNLERSYTDSLERFLDQRLGINNTHFLCCHYAEWQPTLFVKPVSEILWNGWNTQRAWGQKIFYYDFTWGPASLGQKKQTPGRVSAQNLKGLKGRAGMMEERGREEWREIKKKLNAEESRRGSLSSSAIKWDSLGREERTALSVGHLLCFDFFLSSLPSPSLYLPHSFSLDFLSSLETDKNSALVGGGVLIFEVHIEGKYAKAHFLLIRRESMAKIFLSLNLSHIETLILFLRRLQHNCIFSGECTHTLTLSIISYCIQIGQSLSLLSALFALSRSL